MVEKDLHTDAGCLEGISSRPSHRVEEQGAVLPPHSWTDAGVWRHRALGQGTASLQVEGDNLLVQAQLVENAVKRLGVQIQDGDQGSERRRPGASEPAVTTRRRTIISSRKERRNWSLSNPRSPQGCQEEPRRGLASSPNNSGGGECKLTLHLAPLYRCWAPGQP